MLYHYHYVVGTPVYMYVQDCLSGKLQDNSVSSYIRCSSTYCGTGASILTWDGGARVSDVYLTEDSHKTVWAHTCAGAIDKCLHAYTQVKNNAYKILIWELQAC